MGREEVDEEGEGEEDDVVDDDVNDDDDDDRGTFRRLGAGASGGAGGPGTAGRSGGASGGPGGTSPGGGGSSPGPRSGGGSGTGAGDGAAGPCAEKYVSSSMTLPGAGGSFITRVSRISSGGSCDRSVNCMCSYCRAWSLAWHNQNLARRSARLRCASVGPSTLKNFLHPVTLFFFVEDARGLVAPECGLPPWPLAADVAAPPT